MEDLKGYTPEVPKDGGFEPFKFEGWANITKSVISQSAQNTEFYPLGCNMIEIEATVMEGDNIGRKLWKRFNLDDEKQDKNGKTSARKVADQFFAVGLKFNNLEELKEVNERFVDMDVHVKAWMADFKDGRGLQQLWNVKGKKKESNARPAQAEF